MNKSIEYLYEIIKTNSMTQTTIKYKRKLFVVRDIFTVAN